MNENEFELDGVRYVPRNLEWWRVAIGGMCMFGAVRCVQDALEA